jgi:uracil-DNA glycosylase family 4
MTRRDEKMAEVYAEYQADPDLQALRKGAKRFVPGVGRLISPQAMIIGEAPGAKEDELGTPFVGESGNLLDSMLRYAGLVRSECWVTNVVKYRPLNNRTPNILEIEVSIPYLRRESLILGTRTIITLGAVPLSVIDPFRRVSKCHGEAFRGNRWTIVPMYHPAAVVRGAVNREAYREDWLRVKKALS